MLKSLTVINFALIEYITVEFSEGLNILTGETGAGKSILIDALNTVLGGRASVDYIRTNTDFFRVEAVFDLSLANAVEPILQEQGISLEADGALIISRKFSRAGKNTTLINGCNIPLGVLRQIGSSLVDMHGQHENQALLNSDTHLALIDNFCREIAPKLAQYRGVYGEWLGLKKELDALKNRTRETAQRVDMLKWQIEEINAAALQPNEEEKLEKEIDILSHAEKISTAAVSAYNLLNSGAKGSGGVLTLLADIKHNLEVASRYDPKITPQLTVVTDSLYQLEETSTDLRLYADSCEFNPSRLNTLQQRMDVIYKLKKKYGASVHDILAYCQTAQRELADITNYDERIEKLAKAQAQLVQKLSLLADELHILRKRAGASLAEQITMQLQELGMAKAVFQAELNKAETFSNTGCTEVALLFSANQGEEAKPLEKVASGGELSRIALAIKALCSRRDAVHTMIFDEIDTGIGGQTAQMVAEKIALVAAFKQVLCITHLPQIAAMADLHMYIEKVAENERTHTMVRSLSKEAAVMEIARMASGNNSTQTAQENAKEMLKSAFLKKEQWRKV
ncbi:MAG: DNA repair protein RecN [Pelosinus sp.]|nr:DNA repair protein RecN [Pelosinus sp.]